MQTAGCPSFIGIPSAPGYGPKYESNERFSCMLTTTWRILWIPSFGEGGLAVETAGGCGPGRRCDECPPQPGSIKATAAQQSAIDLGAKASVRYSSLGSKSRFRAPHTGQNHVSGMSSNGVPGGMPPSGSPSAGS